jgi:hypothetical protein
LRRNLYEKERDELKALWREGVESGQGRFENMKALRTEAQRRLLEQQQTTDG